MTFVNGSALTGSFSDQYTTMWNCIVVGFTFCADSMSLFLMEFNAAGSRLRTNTLCTSSTGENSIR